MRGRVGYAFDRLLLYATGGWACGGIEDKINGTVANTETLTNGWAAGGGFEYGFARSWTARAEYLYMDLGRSNLGFSYEKNQIVRFGVNYLFK